jgi:hypothetical protein
VPADPRGPQWAHWLQQHGFIPDNNAPALIEEIATDAA